MSTSRSAALALVAGTLAGFVTMLLHPTGGDVVAAAARGGPNALVAAVHWLAILAEPLLLAGTFALTLHFRARRDLAVAAYAFRAVAGVAVLVAAVASGLLSPAVLDGLPEADAATRALLLRDLHYTGLVNRAFASVFVVCSGIAIGLWSLAALAGRELPRALAVFGLVLACALVLGLASGHLRLGVHGFGLVVLGEGVWMLGAARVLRGV